MDLSELKTYLNCDDTFLKVLLEKFIEEVKEITKNMENATANEKWPVVKLNAHKMLSSVKIFEIDELVTLLEKIEMDAETKDNIPELKNNSRKIRLLVEKTIFEMQTALKELE